MKIKNRQKIILPLLIIMLIPVLYMTVSGQLQQNRIVEEMYSKQRERALNDVMALIHTLKPSPESRQIVLDYMSEAGIDGAFILEKGQFVYKSLDISSVDVSMINDMRRVDQDETWDYDLDYRVYNQWGWVIGALTERQGLADGLHMDKMTIVFIVLFILFSIEGVIVITNNVYKPIGILLRGYNDILSGNYQSTIDIQTEDDFGLLSKAFNDMKNTIAKRTNEYLRMRSINENILSGLSTGVITSNTEGQILRYNDAAQDIIFREESGAFDTEIIKVLVKQIMKTLSTGEILNDLQVLSVQNVKEPIYLDVNTTLMKNTSGQVIGAICSFTDISQRKRVEERIERLDRLASLGQLSAGLAHEIRNPLSGMKMSMQVLSKRLSSTLSETDNRLFEANIQEIDRLNGLITNLLDFSKPQIPKKQDVCIQEVLEHTIKFSLKGIREKDIKVVRVGFDNLVWGQFDKGQLSQVCLNLISNAIEALDKDGQLKLTVSYEQNTTNREWGTIKLLIEDNGMGIPAENINKIFDPFFTTRETGTGLGLSVVHELLVANGGDIEVYSQVNQGTAFVLTIPAVEGKYEKESANSR